MLVQPGEKGQGPVDVLIGLDGPTSSAASVIPILRVLDQRLGRLTLARVLDFESMRDDEARARASLTLSCASLFLCHHQPSIVLVPGHGWRALVAHAVAAKYDVVVIVTGPRRRPLSGSIQGVEASVDVPVLLVTALRVDDPGDVAKLLLVLALQFVTAPVGAHMIGRAAYRAGTELSPTTTCDELARDREGGWQP